MRARAHTYVLCQEWNCFFVLFFFILWSDSRLQFLHSSDTLVFPQRCCFSQPSSPSTSPSPLPKKSESAKKIICRRQTHTMSQQICPRVVVGKGGGEGLSRMRERTLQFCAFFCHVIVSGGDLDGVGIGMNRGGNNNNDKSAQYINGFLIFFLFKPGPPTICQRT